MCAFTPLPAKCSHHIINLEKCIQNYPQICKVDKIVHQIFVHITAFELGGLCGFWDHLSKRFFARLERSFMSSVRKLEYCLKRYYLVYAIQVRAAQSTPPCAFSTNRHADKRRFVRGPAFFNGSVVGVCGVGFHGRKYRVSFFSGGGCRAACRDIELPIFNPVQHAAIVGNRIKILPNHPPPAATTASAWYYSTSFWTHHRVEFGAVPLLLLTDVLLRHCLVMGMWVCTFAVVAKNGRQDRVTHFFETLAPELQSQPEWREWFGTEPNHTSDSFTYMLGQN